MNPSNLRIGAPASGHRPSATQGPFFAARHNHDVRLTRARAWREAEPFSIITWHRPLHHLDCAACKTKCHPHQRAAACPRGQFVSRGDDKTFVSELLIEGRKTSIAKWTACAGIQLLPASSIKGCCIGCFPCDGQRAGKLKVRNRCWNL
jgi:hypothetical protein